MGLLLPCHQDPPRAGVTRVPLPGHLQVQWKCPRAHSATGPNSSVTAPAQAPLHLGVNQLQKNLFGDIGVWHQPWGGLCLLGPRGSSTCGCPQVCGGHWVGETPWVRTVLAGAEVFHLPQFLLIKRMNYSSVAASGICHPCPGHTGGAELCSRPGQGGFCETPPGQLCPSSVIYCHF